MFGEPCYFSFASENSTGAALSVISTMTARSTWSSPPSVGYASSSDKRVHCGLGADRRIREIELRWPSGKVQVLKDVVVDQVLKVIEELGLR